MNALVRCSLHFYSIFNLPINPSHHLIIPDSRRRAATDSVSCSHLLTCDDRFRKRYTGPLKLLSPADFVVEYFQQNL